MRNLLIFIEKNGAETYVGNICGDTVDDACFCYSEEYRSSENSVPISISLPFQTEAFTAEQTKIYFEGLLPEGFSRKAVAGHLHVDENDYLSILSNLGHECLGAIKVLETGADSVQSFYEPLSIQQVRELAQEGVTKSIELVTEAHLSLTGASGKVGLYYDEEKDAWFLPRGDAPSTHIVKQSHVRLDQLVLNEQLALRAAGNLGISVPESFIINTGDGKDEDVLLASRRYDRLLDGTERVIGGMRWPMRLHQEDFAQAMGIPASDKYEQEEGNYLRSMFDILRYHSSNPLEDQIKLWDMVIYNFLIGNTDGHIKNFSLLYSQDLQSIRLAPAYDIVSTCIYRSSARDMAFRIGEKYRIDVIREEDFAAAAIECGLGQKMAMGRFRDLADRFENALTEAVLELEAQGFENVTELKERLLPASGYGKLDKRKIGK